MPGFYLSRECWKLNWKNSTEHSDICGLLLNILISLGFDDLLSLLLQAIRLLLISDLDKIFLFYLNVPINLFLISRYFHDAPGAI